MGRKRRHSRLPEQADRHLQQLMDRNNEGLLTDQERKELAALAELSETLRSSVLKLCIYLAANRKVHSSWQMDLVNSLQRGLASGVSIAKCISRFRELLSTLSM